MTQLTASVGADQRGAHTKYLIFKKDCSCAIRLDHPPARMVSFIRGETRLGGHLRAAG